MEKMAPKENVTTPQRTTSSKSKQELSSMKAYHFSGRFFSYETKEVEFNPWCVSRNISKGYVIIKIANVVYLTHVMHITVL